MIESPQRFFYPYFFFFFSDEKSVSEKWKFFVGLRYISFSLRSVRKVKSTHGELNNLEALCGKLLMAARVAPNRTSKRPTPGRNPLERGARRMRWNRGQSNQSLHDMTIYTCTCRSILRFPVLGSSVTELVRL